MRQYKSGRPNDRTVRPPTQGSWTVEALCTGCHHKWIAVCPEGTPNLECPACHTLGPLVFGDTNVDGA